MFTCKCMYINVKRFLYIPVYQNTFTYEYIGDKTFVNIAETLDLIINIDPLSSSTKEHSKDPYLKESSSSSLPSSTSNEYSSKEHSLSPYTQLSSLLHSIIKKSEKPSRRFLLSGRINDLNIKNKKNDLNLEFNSNSNHINDNENENSFEKIDNIDPLSSSAKEHSGDLYLKECSSPSVPSSTFNGNSVEKIDNIDDYNISNDIWMSKIFKIITQLYIEK